MSCMKALFAFSTGIRATYIPTTDPKSTVCAYDLNDDGLR